MPPAGSYITNGHDLLQVLEIGDGLLIVEDVKTLDQRSLTLNAWRLYDWRMVRA